ncbi:NADP-dependent 3-hydroxy acid dehydrogenase YdfG [Amorphus suaedae]
MTGLKDKVVAITGASSGIGEATALLLAERGASVMLGARRADRLEALVRRIAEGGGAAASRVMDVTVKADVQGLVDDALDRFGRLDVLVSCAGVGLISRMDERRVDDWDRMIDINVKGPLYGMAAALPVFQAQGSGQFVNVLSTAGIKIVPTMGVYAGSKNAIRAVSEALRQEAGPNLRVTVISPGAVATDFGAAITNDGLRAEIVAMQEKIGIAPAAIARAIAFAIEQPADVEIGEIVVRPTAQG